MSENKKIDEATGTQTVGHEWDGIEELNTPLPRWWLLTFYACVIWGLAYTVFYPAWPLVSSATAGVTGWTSRGQLDAEMKAETTRKAPIMAALASTPFRAMKSCFPPRLKAGVQRSRSIACNAMDRVRRVPKAIRT